MRRVRNVLGTALLVLVALPACGDDNGSGGVEGVFVGPVADSDAYIAIISDGENVSGYACDDGRSSLWFGATAVDNGEADLEGRDGDVLGSVRFDDDEASGTITIDGERHSFGAERAEGEAGAYRTVSGERGDDDYVEVGWVVLRDGSQRGAMIIGPAFMVESVQPLDTKSSAILLSGFGTLSVTKLSTNFTASVVN